MPSFVRKSSGFSIAAFTPTSIAFATNHVAPQTTAATLAPRRHSTVQPTAKTVSETAIDAGYITVSSTRFHQGAGSRSNGRKTP